MKFKDKYTNAKEKDPNKTEISNESYAVCELLEELSDKLERLRLTSILKR